MIHAGKEWKEMPGFKGYYISADAEILSFKREKPRIMKHMIDTDGYHYVFMYSEPGKQSKIYVHRAVLSAWDRLPEPGEEGRHLNDNSDENELSNLAWGSRMENVQDKRKNGRQPFGEQSASHKLTEHQVMEIRKLYGKIPIRKLGEMYGVAHTTIRRAAIGMRWTHLKEETNG